MSTKENKDILQYRLEAYNDTVENKLKVSRRYNYYALDYINGRVFKTGLSFKELCLIVDTLYDSLYIK